MVNISISAHIYKKIKKIAEIRGNTISETLNEIVDDFEKNNDKKEIPDSLIANKDTYNPNPESIMEMAGIIKLDEPFDAVKAVRDIRVRKY